MMKAEIQTESIQDRFQKDITLASFTTMKIGGEAEYFFPASSTEDLVKAVLWARKHKIPVYVIGGGSNVLIGDKGIKGLVIKNNTGSVTIKAVKGEIKNGRSEKVVYVEADSGVAVNKLVRFTIEEGLAGLEMHLGLPGTVGGAVYMNSKWTKPLSYVGDTLYQADILTPRNKRRTVSGSYFKFNYDYSYLQESGDILLRAIFALRCAPKEKLWEIANKSMSYRRESQPVGVFSAGCTFKNIEKVKKANTASKNNFKSAGELIDLMGFKGKACNDAYVSDKHANFIINRKHAKASDVVKLISEIKKYAKSRYGIRMEEEIRLIGDF